MRDIYRGYFRPHDASEKQTWKESAFVFDANILLNFYRYSDQTRADFLQILTLMKDRIWLPHQAGLEYLENRTTVINTQQKLYDESLKQIHGIMDAFQHAKQHPFVSDDSLKDLSSIIERIQNELTYSKSEYGKRLWNDDIQERLADIFAGRVGEKFNEEEMLKVFEEGKHRYAERVPPGYKDHHKAATEDSYRAKRRTYGDLIIWKEVLRFGKELSKNISFITDDRKEDWWRQAEGKTLGPRAELVEEFFDYTGQTFEMYEAHRFFEKSSEILAVQSQPETIEEIREVGLIKRRNTDTDRVARHDSQRKLFDRSNRHRSLPEVRATELWDLIQRLELEERHLDARIAHLEELSNSPDESDEHQSMRMFELARSKSERQILRQRKQKTFDRIINFESQRQAIYNEMMEDDEFSTDRYHGVSSE